MERRHLSFLLHIWSLGLQRQRCVYVHVGKDTTCAWEEQEAEQTLGKTPSSITIAIGLSVGASHTQAPRPARCTQHLHEARVEELAPGQLDADKPADGRNGSK